MFVLMNSNGVYYFIIIREQKKTTFKHMHVNGIEDITLSGQRDGANRMGNSISLHLS